MLERIEEKPPFKNSLVKGLKQTYREFCANTSIHGFQYFGQHRPRKEIIFWLLVFVITIYFCSSIIVRIYVKWHESPVIVTFSDKPTPIWNIPFPRVTICPEAKRTMNKTVDDNYLQLMKKLKTFLKQDGKFNENFNESQLEESLTLKQICLSDVIELDDIAQPLRPAINYIDILNRMQPSGSKYFLSCSWFGETLFSCDELFTKVYTEEGICYAYNGLKADDMYRDEVLKSQLRNEPKGSSPLEWTLQKGYPAHGELHTYPARLLSSGYTSGLEVFLVSYPDEVDSTCNWAMPGFKISLNSPDEVPILAKHFVPIAGDKKMLIAIKPKMITTSVDVAAYDARKRRCFMNEERHLRFYKIYSQNNCERECLTNITYSQCGCVHFAMPRFQGTAVCHEDKMDCMIKSEKQLLLKHFLDNLQGEEQSFEKSIDNCNCLPACTSLEYETEITEANFDFVNILRDNDLYEDETVWAKFSILSIYFKDSEFITSRRSELYGVTELLANFGGVVGLFMGISILSVVEIVYHFTLRLWQKISSMAEAN
uniref:Pickpocket protein 28-like n=1 Tax=Stomoxys calcitrans TaxID=35570 RepID=A0A1I8P290_STOCA